MSTPAPISPAARRRCSTPGRPKAPEGERRQIILALGAEALRENETWLREHRERPLEPIVGG